MQHAVMVVRGGHQNFGTAAVNVAAVVTRAAILSAPWAPLDASRINVLGRRKILNGHTHGIPTHGRLEQEGKIKTEGFAQSGAERNRHPLA